MPEEAFRSTMETNYFSVVRLMKMVLPEMRRRGSGTIVNVTSVTGRVATLCQGAYTWVSPTTPGTDDHRTIPTLQGWS